MCENRSRGCEVACSSNPRWASRPRSCYSRPPTARARCHRQYDRDHHRVVRLLSLLLRDGAGVRQAVLPQFRAAGRHPAAFGIFAVGLLARPIGAFIFGHYGDRISRKSTLSFDVLLNRCRPHVSLGRLLAWHLRALLPTAPRFIRAWALAARWLSQGLKVAVGQPHEHELLFTCFRFELGRTRDPLSCHGQ